MTLMLPTSPELEKRLAQEASRLGIDVSDLAFVFSITICHLQSETPKRLH